MSSQLSTNQSTPIIKYSHSPNHQTNGFRNKLSSLFKFGREEKREKLDDISGLVAGIDKLSVDCKSALKSAKATKKAAKSFAKWAEKGSNSAIDDVMQKVSQVMQLHADSQAQFAKDYELCLQKLQKVGQTELRMKETVKKLNKVRAHERQLQKKIRKLMANEEDTVLLRRQLDQAILARESAEKNLAKERAETEVVKMFQFREAMMDLADAQKVLATKTLALSNCQKKVTQFVPAVSTQNVNQMMYEGAVYTQEHLEELRQCMTLHNFPHASHALTVRHTRPDAQLVVNRSEDIAPPPYSCTQPILHEYTPLQSNSHAEDGRAKQTSNPKVNVRFVSNKRKRT